MGRHSAPDEEGGQEQRVVAVLDVATLLGRHSPGRPAPKPRRAAEPDDGSEALPVVAMLAPARAEPETEADQVGLALIEDALAVLPVEEAPSVEEAHTTRIAPIVEPEPSVPEAPTTQFPPVEESVAAEPVAEEPVAAEPSVAAQPSTPLTTGARAASSDLALLRAHGDVRARCLAAVLVPFVLYVVVLVLIGSLALTTFLIWIWLPLISAGILIGLFLDSAHKRYALPPGDAVSGSADRP